MRYQQNLKRRKIAIIELSTNDWNILKPTVLDGGVSGFSTGDVAEQFMRGFLRARDTQAALKSRGEAPSETVERLTFLAGAAHATDTQAGIAKAFEIGNTH